MTKRTKRNAGNAMVEFALIAAILLPTFMGVFEFGYAFYTYNRLVGTVRAGARYASLLRYDSASSTPSADFQNKVKNLVVYGSPSGGQSPLVPNLSTSQITVTMNMVNSSPDSVTVGVSNYSVDTLFIDLDWSQKPKATFRYQGQWAPL